MRLPVDDYRRFLFGNRHVNILFFDDGSIDRTNLVLENLKSEFLSQIGILTLDKNVGKAEAIRQGILTTAHLDKKDIIGFMDADLSTPFEELDCFIREFNNPSIHFVFGSRFSRIGAKIVRFHHRHYFGRFVATFVSIYLRIPIYDSQCGAKFFHVDFARKLFMRPFVSRWLFDVELFKRIHLLNLKVEECSLELPLHVWIEKGGSKIAFRDYLALPFEFARICLHYFKRENRHHSRIHSYNLTITTKII
jgi:glycosyltransferase involved in cell wall biosynthesis